MKNNIKQYILKRKNKLGFRLLVMYALMLVILLPDLLLSELLNMHLDIFVHLAFGVLLAWFVMWYLDTQLLTEREEVEKIILKTLHYKMQGTNTIIGPDGKETDFKTVLGIMKGDKKALDNLISQMKGTN